MENYSGKAMLDALDTTLGTQSRNADLGDASARATGGKSAEAADLLPRNWGLPDGRRRALLHRGRR